MKNHLLSICIVFGIVPLFLGYLGRHNWFFDLFSHFRLYYLIYFALMGLVAIAAKKRKEAVISMALALFLSFTILKFYLPHDASKSIPDQTLRIASINVLSLNENYKAVNNFIIDGSFDLVFIQELTPRWHNEIEKIEGYPYQVHIPRLDNFGIGVISKVELDTVINLDLSDVEIPSLLVELKLGDQELQILGTHPLPPLGKQYFQSRNNQFEMINNFVNRSDTELVVIGDFNSTVFSPNFDRILQNGKLHDSRLNFGILPTWNAQWGIHLITLDHAFITSGIEVIHRGIGRPIGSDHLPIIIEIGLK